MALVVLACTPLAVLPTAASARPTSGSGIEVFETTCRNNGGGGGFVSCSGKDPVEMNCAQNSTKAFTTTRHGIFFELRYSASCQAYWTRYTNQGGDYGEARIKGTTLVSFKTLAVYRGETGWTRMLSAAQNPKACMFWDDRELGWTKSCVPRP